jgi:hypothetical protein
MISPNASLAVSFNGVTVCETASYIYFVRWTWNINIAEQAFRPANDEIKHGPFQISKLKAVDWLAGQSLSLSITP